MKDNQITELPMDMSGLIHIANLNLNGNQFSNVSDRFNIIMQLSETIQALQSLPNLRSVYMNLFKEDQVDYIMRTLENLEFLNGLKVERGILYEGDQEEQEEEEDSSDSDSEQQSNRHEDDITLQR